MTAQERREGKREGEGGKERGMEREGQGREGERDGWMEREGGEEGRSRRISSLTRNPGRWLCLGGQRLKQGSLSASTTRLTNVTRQPLKQIRVHFCSPEQKSVTLQHRTKHLRSFK